MQERYDFVLRSSPLLFSVLATADFDKYSAYRTLGSDSVTMCSGRETVLHTVSSIFDSENCRAVEMRHGRRRYLP